MPRRSEKRTEEHEVQRDLRNSAISVILVLLALTIVVGLFAPLIADRTPDTSVLIGFASSLVGGVIALVLARAALFKGKVNDEDEDE